MLIEKIKILINDIEVMRTSPALIDNDDVQRFAQNILYALNMLIEGSDTEFSIDEDIKLLQATKLMLLGNDGQPISDLYDAIENGIEAIVFYRSIVKCKDCKYFEYNAMTNFEEIPLIMGHEVCMKWAGGCKSNENGFCFMGERRANE